MAVKIISTGAFVSEEVLTNEDLSKLVDTTNEWILDRTGIETRHISKDLTTEEMAYRACKQAIEKAAVDPQQIGLLICSTITPDTVVPSSAFTISGKLGVGEAVCFDLNAACSGFIYSVSVAGTLMSSLGIKYALIVGVERLSKFIDRSDRGTCILFGDGAACALLRNDAPEFEAAGEKEELAAPYNLEIIEMMLGGSYDAKKYLSMLSKDTADDSASPYIRMNGRQIYKFATMIGGKIVSELLEKSGVNPEEIALVVPHQANRRIIDTLSEKSSIPLSKWFMNLNKYGNTSSASVPLALNEVLEDFDFAANRGKYIVSLAFGGGLSYGGLLIKIK